MSKKIAVIIGSLRKEAWSRKLAKALIKLAPSSLELEIVEIGQLPLYNQDPDDHDNPLPEWVAFRKKMKTFDGFLFVTPEYNRSIPAPLKNAIDVGSRPYGKSIWGGKPGAVISSSPGAPGGFGANQHLRQTFVFLDIWCMQAPEAYVGHVDKIFDKEGHLSNDQTREFLTTYMESFEKWVYRF
ncbi:chromate reductase, Class I, flavoprotein [Legionella lansingensis]|uniref:Chromate reductase, Class I, flavoprotein n=1 Tax=Legionella lansingensis TaxID=45067 RepID=A0A0W0VFF1_9GAMM|nr:NAD(P)H-dependent oxidoreductase [Legionella lansingensis]KTD18534.1 chromate reductase, Class I, flavoprotein [Legionella lansingensis]SNV50947.1 chromate reductase, Class I, flavoprotein [Legionella lansingensis]